MQYVADGFAAQVPCNMLKFCGPARGWPRRGTSPRPTGAGGDAEANPRDWQALPAIRVALRGRPKVPARSRPSWPGFALLRQGVWSRLPVWRRVVGFGYTLLWIEANMW